MDQDKKLDKLIEKLESVPDGGENHSGHLTVDISAYFYTDKNAAYVHQIVEEAMKRLWKELEVLDWHNEEGYYNVWNRAGQYVEEP